MPLYPDMEQTVQTILVVEDEVLIRMCTAAALEDAGFRVLEAKDSAEALAVLEAYPQIGVIVTDVQMPGHMDGLALVTQVRREHGDIRLLVVSGNATASAAFGAGAMGFLAKPYTVDDMLRAVNRLPPPGAPPATKIGCAA